MDQIKPAADLSNDQSVEQDVAAKSNDLRTLSELELVCCGGGEGGVCW
jgi:hypothetical protein